MAERYGCVIGLSDHTLDNITAITSAEIAIVMTYYQLCSEDYNWWWRSFLTPGSSALYLFIYACVYFHTKLEITGTVSVMLYFGYMGMIAWCVPAPRMRRAAPAIRMPPEPT